MNEDCRISNAIADKLRAQQACESNRNTSSAMDATSPGLGHISGAGANTACRERTARESLEQEAKNAILRAATIHAKIVDLDRLYGRSLLEMSESVFRTRFSLDAWGPF